MKTYTEQISTLLEINAETCIQFSNPLMPQPLPGQYLQAFTLEQDDLLPIQLFPCQKEHNCLLFHGKIPKNWLPGMLLKLRGPFGNGFHIPPMARHVALFNSSREGVNRLLGLADLALTNQCEVVFISETPVSHLAPEIEVLSENALEEVKNWADYMAVFSPASRIKSLHQKLSACSAGNSSPVIEVLMETPMVCTKNAECGLCAILTVKGWKYACKDGPVFLLEDLSEEENGG